MGQVFRAWDSLLRRSVAVKFLQSHRLNDGGESERVAAEARAAAAIDHPNVCTIYDVGIWQDGRPFLTMPFYEGETLAVRLRRGLPSIEELSSILAQVAAGLEAAHRRGVIHQDIKPSNLLLLSDGLVKVIDFGLARRADYQTRSQQRRSEGTLGYMAPEQFEMAKVDEKADVWSLAVLAYESLTGQRPFRGSSAGSYVCAVLTKTPKPLAELRPDVPEDLATLVRSCLHKSPRRRPSSLQVLRALRQVAEVVGDGSRNARPLKAACSLAVKPPTQAFARADASPARYADIGTEATLVATATTLPLS